MGITVTHDPDASSHFLDLQMCKESSAHQIQTDSDSEMNKYGHKRGVALRGSIAKLRI